MNIVYLLLTVAMIGLMAVALRGLEQIGRNGLIVLQRPKRNKGMRRTWRKVYLLPVGIQRLIGWLPGQRLGPNIQFANIAQGTYEHGVKSYIPDGGTTARYLLYKRGTDADHCAICGAGDDPLGTSDDQADANNLDVPIAIKLCGAAKGTQFVVTDGTAADGDYLKCGATGKATKAATGDLCFGRAAISTDMTKADTDVIGYIGVLPSKLTF